MDTFALTKVWSYSQTAWGTRPKPGSKKDLAPLRGSHSSAMQKTASESFFKHWKRRPDTYAFMNMKLNNYWVTMKKQRKPKRKGSKRGESPYLAVSEKSTTFPSSVQEVKTRP